MIKHFTKLIGLLALLWGSQTQALQVTVSTPPLAGLIKPLLAEDDQLTVLLQAGASPHGFQLKPSHLRSIQNSDAIFSIGTPVDGWLNKTLSKIDKPVLKMSELSGLYTLPLRKGGLWKISNQDSEHAHDDHNHKPAKWHYDGHIWLSPKNARLFVEQAAELIKQLDAVNAEQVELRKQAWLVKLIETEQQLTQQLLPVKDRPFVVLHDAYQYFEQHFQLNGVGSIRLNPEIAPSLKRVQALRESIKASQVSCIFKEPQFPEKRVLAVVRGLDIQIGSLDPMGSFSSAQDSVLAKEGYLAYDMLLKNIANAMSDCLAEKAK